MTSLVDPDLGWAAAALVLGLLLLPGYGLVALWRHRASQRGRERIEDALKHLLEEEYRGRHASFASVAGSQHLSDRRTMDLLSRMQRQGLVESHGRTLHLTLEGERLALQVVRAHRLLERYLVDEARLPLRRVHQEAERQEHRLSTEQVDRLSAALGHPLTDPHGDPIPTRDGYVAPAEGTSLTAWPLESLGRIVHLEDEPPLAYAQIVAEGLEVGRHVRILERSPERVMLSDGNREYRLAPAVADNVFLVPVAEASGEVAQATPLADLPDRRHAIVAGLAETCQGFTRRRLLDLGFTKGTRVTSALRTFAGDPRAYRLRGTTIALRRDQASQILVTEAASESDDAAAKRVAGQEGLR